MIAVEGSGNQKDRWLFTLVICEHQKLVLCATFQLVLVQGIVALFPVDRKPCESSFCVSLLGRENYVDVFYSKFERFQLWEKYTLLSTDVHSTSGTVMCWALTKCSSVCCRSLALIKFDLIYACCMRNLHYVSCYLTSCIWKVCQVDFLVCILPH